MGRATTRLRFRKNPGPSGQALASAHGENFQKLEDRIGAKVQFVELTGWANLSINQYVLCEDKDIVVTKVELLSDIVTAGSSGTHSWDLVLYNLTQTENVATWESDNEGELAVDTLSAMTLAAAANLQVAADDLLELQITKVDTPTDMTTAVIKLRISFYVKGSDA